MNKNIIRESTSDTPIIIDEGGVGVIGENGESIRTIEKDVWDGQIPEDQLAAMHTDVGFTCSICGKDKPGELGISIGDLKDVCSDCYNQGIAWAIWMAAKERSKGK